jgi:hypothetical protein
MASFKNDGTTPQGRYMIFLDNAEIALKLAISRGNVEIEMMPPSAQKEAMVKKVSAFARELVFLEAQDTAFINGKPIIQAPTDAQVAETKKLADDLAKVIQDNEGFTNVVTIATKVVKLADKVFGNDPAVKPFTT